jgi:hypothetical protein
LAFGIVVEGEGTFGGRVGAPDFDTGAGGAEGGHYRFLVGDEWLVGVMDGYGGWFAVIVIVDAASGE